LDRGSARRKATTCTEDSKYTEERHTDIHGSSGIRIHDPSVPTGEDSSHLRQRGNCDRLQQGTKSQNKIPFTATAMKI
jgi:hypothetical protein